MKITFKITKTAAVRITAAMANLYKNEHYAHFDNQGNVRPSLAEKHSLSNLAVCWHTVGGSRYFVDPGTCRAIFEGSRTSLCNSAGFGGIHRHPKNPNRFTIWTYGDGAPAPMILERIETSVPSWIPGWDDPFIPDWIIFNHLEQDARDDAWHEVGARIELELAE